MNKILNENIDLNMRTGQFISINIQWHKYLPFKIHYSNVQPIYKVQSIKPMEIFWRKYIKYFFR